MDEDEQTDAAAALTEQEREALHQVELGLEWLQRAHGHLIEFHHNTGHAMDHLADAETMLRECGYEELANALRDQYLPRGVIDEDRWSYDVLECFQEDILADIRTFETETREAVADGQRHVAERTQKWEWRERARRD
ncbi:hypothetical protein ACFR9U_12195 [Halorientalis brevis]|uniref:Uncharacterized protein n=1 Tax=Halorientalis brevis TaxID=1126241 RepID=A0ABD6CBN8_9EURY|nr:hypothetical protein [Halorientalis brevis]